MEQPKMTIREMCNKVEHCKVLVPAAVVNGGRGWAMVLQDPLGTRFALVIEGKTLPALTGNLLTFTQELSVTVSTDPGLLRQLGVEVVRDE